MDQLMQISFGLIIFGGVFDLLTKKIPNWLNFPAMAIGLALQFYWGSWSGLAAGVLGLLSGFALYYPLYYKDWMGAGDVKLLMMVGAWTSALICMRVAIIAILIGGLFAVLEIIYRGRFFYVVKSIYRFIRSLFISGLEREFPELDKERKFPFGFCMALAMFALMILQRNGVWV